MDAIVVCSNKNSGIGLEIWDLENGDCLHRLPSCASQPNGLTCLRNQYLVASQVQRTGSIGDGAIFMWPLNRHQGALRTNNVMEEIRPISSTKDGIYLAGGANSGNIYIWEVTSGRLLKKWCAHRKSVTCLVFTKDDSFLVSGSQDGTIGMWPMINLLDENNLECFPYLFSYSNEHKEAITGLISTSANSNSIIISSSLDGTCKIWDVVIGKPVNTKAFPLPITAIVLDIVENFLFCGSYSGAIFIQNFDVGLDNTLPKIDGPQFTLNGHNKPITALGFCKFGLVSASGECTVCLWDIAKCAIIREYKPFKGPITNLIVICKSLLSINNLQSSPQLCISSLDKYSQSFDLAKQFMTPLPSSDYAQENMESCYRSTKLLISQACDLQMESTPEALQLKVETNRASQIREISMTKHMMKINTYMQGSYTDLLHGRLMQDSSED